MERFFQASKRQVPPFSVNSHPSVQNRSTLQLIYHLFLLRLALGISPFGQSLLDLPPIEADQFHQPHIAKEPSCQFIHRLAPKENLEQIQQQKLHRRDQHSAHSRQLLLL